MEWIGKIKKRYVERKEQTQTIYKGENILRK